MTKLCVSSQLVCYFFHQHHHHSRCSCCKLNTSSLRFRFASYVACNTQNTTQPIHISLLLFSKSSKMICIRWKRVPRAQLNLRSHSLFEQCTLRDQILTKKLLIRNVAHDKFFLILFWRFLMAKSWDTLQSHYFLYIYVYSDGSIVYGCFGNFMAKCNCHNNTMKDLKLSILVFVFISNPHATNVAEK